MPDPFADPFEPFIGPMEEDPFADDPFADPPFIGPADDPFREPSGPFADPVEDPFIGDPFAEPPEYSGRESEPDPYVRSKPGATRSRADSYWADYDQGLRGFSHGYKETNSDRHYTPGGDIQSHGDPQELYGLPAYRENAALFADGEILQGMTPILPGGRKYHEPGPRSFGPGMQDHPLSFAMQAGPSESPHRQRPMQGQPQMPAPPQHLGPQQGGGSLIKDFGPLLKALMQGRQ